MNGEMPKPIPGYDGYFCDEHGLVFCGDRPLTPRMARTGYVVFSVRVDGSSKGLTGHRAVALAWIGLPPTGKPCAAHNDGNRTNNHVSNLRWVSYAENEADKKMHGTHGSGLRNVQSKVDEQTAKEILRARERGLTFRKIAPLFGISNTTAREICIGRHWTTAGKVAPISEYERRLETWRQKHNNRKDRALSDVAAQEGEK